MIRRLRAELAATTARDWLVGLAIAAAGLALVLAAAAIGLGSWVILLLIVPSTVYLRRSGRPLGSRRGDAGRRGP